MRKPRDYDAELRVLEDKARQLRERRLQQLGELVIATGADALPVELLTGALLSAVANNDLVTKDEWRKRGAAFFQGSRRSGGGARGNPRRAPAKPSGTAPAAGADGAS